ncbi:hypothetical protein JKP88DRAFT_219610 [Tribonema minus]|uniref:Uncharacterized protein n=1 Tax=Tribonema minus TaxID=303371 RepID=A0A835Z792_9STRA|nr:hypothetical protein JKP88DRAFT_219610 [Tribonema minus]
MSMTVAGVTVLFNILDQLGAVPSGTVRDCETYVAFLNDWEGRDSRAHAEGTYGSGRFSYDGTVHGKWYCCLKRR